MKKIQLITDGASDITNKELEEKGIINIPFYVLNGQEEKYYTNDELYSVMLENKNQFFKSACPSIQIYYDAFLNSLKAGKAVICVCLTLAFSASYNAAKKAADMLLEENSEYQICVIDSKMNTVLQGMLVLEIAKMIENDIAFDDICKRALELREEGQILFTVENINYLKQGGRIGLLKSFLAKAVSIKPIINMEKGNIKPGGFGIGLTRTLHKIVDKLKEIIPLEKIKKYHFSVGYSSNLEMGKKFLKIFCEKLHISQNQIELRQIGVTTAVHTGPNTIGIAFLKIAD